MGRDVCHPLREGARAGLAAAVPSGIPSTLHAVLTGGDVLGATRAAGSLLVGERAPSWLRVTAALPVHLALSAGWGTVMAATLPRRSLRRPLVTGAAAGLIVAALDLGVVGRRRPAVRELPVAPQVVDHLVYGITVGVVLARRPV